MNRYDVHSNEGEFQPGSGGRVLRNLVNIRSAADMNELELELLEQLYEAVLLDQLPDRCLNVDDLKTWHRRWLGNVYSWAGQERSVNLTRVASCSHRQGKLLGFSRTSSGTSYGAGRLATN